MKNPAEYIPNCMPENGYDGSLRNVDYTFIQKRNNVQRKFTYKCAEQISQIFITTFSFLCELCNYSQYLDSMALVGGRKANKLQYIWKETAVD